MGDTPVLGGNKGLPPPEMGFLDWVKGATKAAQAKYSDASLIDVTATKKPKSDSTTGTYDLTFQARYSSFLDDPIFVILTGKDYQITTGKSATGTGGIRFLFVYFQGNWL